MTRQNRHVGQCAVTPIEQSQLHMFVWFHIRCKQDTHFLPFGTPAGKFILHYPLSEMLSNHWPLIVDTKLVLEDQLVLFLRHRGDTVHHGVWERRVFSHPIVKLLVHKPGKLKTELPEGVPILGHIVAREHCQTGCPSFHPSFQPSADHAKSCLRFIKILQIMLNHGVLSIKGPVHVLAVTFLGDGQRHDPRIRRSQLFNAFIMVFGGK
mmetsp:Transcript_131635/g.228034  ORF Transcript_131635/g.228034 Transcript_131635/m.228034 type:complete len:209 (+) Transcript_131635:2166-2792(+)